MFALGVISLVILIAASSGAIFKPGNWYKSLQKPRWTPPDWAFGTGWALLYPMIAYATWRAWDAGSGDALTFAMLCFAVQITLNGAWSGIFFGLQRMGLAALELGCLWLSVLVSIIAYGAIDTVAGVLMLPYLAWVTFAGALNLSIWRLNRHLEQAA